VTFDQAFEILLKLEGGEVNDPLDPGGLTKYGISQRAYPGEDISGMTREHAKDLYRRDFWGPAGCDLVPDLVKLELFVFAVNTSTPGSCRTAIRVLQNVVGAHPDGVWGPETQLLVTRSAPVHLLRHFEAAILRYYTSLANFRTYGRGWVNRIATTMESV
jgi:lysozyme family protein